VSSDLESLLAAQSSLRSRFEDFRRALDRRDEEAYRLALADFHRCLVRWTQAEEKALLPAVLRAGIPGRDPQRELHLEWVQIRELTRYLLDQIGARAPTSDVLGLAENLARRFAAHQSEMETVYYPAATSALTAEEWKILGEAAPVD
jgi:hemerythrin HHE cation binding domain-containing protein